MDDYVNSFFAKYISCFAQTCFAQTLPPHCVFSEIHSMLQHVFLRAYISNDQHRTPTATGKKTLATFFYKTGLGTDSDSRAIYGQLAASLRRGGREAEAEAVFSLGHYVGQFPSRYCIFSHHEVRSNHSLSPMQGGRGPPRSPTSTSRD